MSTLLAVLLTLVAAVGERPAAIVQAPDSPVRLERAHVLTSDEAPPVLVYAATNTTNNALEQFTVIAFVFDAKGTLKARQTAPGRRTLDPHGTKYSTLVLDGSLLEPTDLIVVGVNQAQRADSEQWWRADIQSAAEQAVKKGRD